MLLFPRQATVMTSLRNLPDLAVLGIGLQFSERTSSTSTQPQNTNEFNWDTYAEQLLSACPSLQYAVLWCPQARQPWTCWRVLKTQDEKSRHVEEMGEYEARTILNAPGFRKETFECVKIEM